MKKKKKIIAQGVRENYGYWLETLWNDGSLTVEPITQTQANEIRNPTR
jgi:hypothetical protein